MPALAIETDQHRELISKLKADLCPWRKLTIAIDGRDNVGKSSLGRYLAWQLGLPVIELDLLVHSRRESIEYDTYALGRLVSARHDRDRPVIVEGVLVLRALAQIDVVPEALIYVRAEGQEGNETWRNLFDQYEMEFASRPRTFFEFRSASIE